MPRVLALLSVEDPTSQITACQRKAWPLNIGAAVPVRLAPAATSSGTSLAASGAGVPHPGQHRVGRDPGGRGALTAGDLRAAQVPTRDPGASKLPGPAAADVQQLITS